MRSLGNRRGLWVFLFLIFGLPALDGHSSPRSGFLPGASPNAEALCLVPIHEALGW